MCKKVEEKEVTLNQEWLDKNTDRLIAWEIFKRYLTLNCREIPSQKLCDMIGVPKNYVFNAIKRAQKVCAKKPRNH